MRFAVLGTDPDIIALIAAAGSLGHEIAWLSDARPTDAAALAATRSPLPTPSTAWEILLDEATADAVLVGRGLASAELRAEQLKRLVTDAVPMLVVHPVCDSVLTYYEVDMVRRETRCLVRHYNPFLGHPKLAEIAACSRDEQSALGPIHQVSCERHLADFARDTVMSGLARDAELLAFVAGNIRKVSAVGPQIADSSYASLQVQFTTDAPPSLRWSIAPQVGRGNQVQLTLLRDNGYLRLKLRDKVGDHAAVEGELEELSGNERHSTPLPVFDAPRFAIEQFAAAVAAADPAQRAAASTWEKATQSMEVVDAVELSLQKGRTMEVHQQQLTEQLAFRGTMAALGCGLLLVGFFVLVVATMLGGIETVMDRKLFPAWPIVLLAVLAFFLLLQAIPLMATRKNTGSNANSREP